MKKYDIFISYRREGGYDTAKHLYDLLTRDGYRVSFDIDTLGDGDFDKQLYERIEQCRDFILIVDQHAFDKCIDGNVPKDEDWLRCELSYALENGKNIIPVFLSGVKGFPDNLPNDIAGIVKKQGPEFNRYYFNDFYRGLKKRFLHKPMSLYGKRILFITVMAAVLCVSAYLISRPAPKYKFKETNEFVECVSKWNSLKSYTENASKEGNKYMTWYLTNIENKDMAQNQEFGEAYLRYIVIKPLVLAYIAFSIKDLEAEQDVDFVNSLIDYCYKAIPADNRTAFSFNSSEEEERINQLKTDLDICIQQLQMRSDLTKLDDDFIPLLKATIISSSWGGLK